MTKGVACWLALFTVPKYQVYLYSLQTELVYNQECELRILSISVMFSPMPTLTSTNILNLFETWYLTLFYLFQ